MALLALYWIRLALYPIWLALYPMSLLKQLPRKLLRKMGREVVRISRVPYRTIDVFDLVLRKYKDLEEVRFIQVGAFDGLRCDPIHDYIVGYHWKGILLEPQLLAFRQLQKTYSNESQLILENCALAELDGFKTMYTSRMATGSSYEAMCAGFDRQQVRANLGLGHQVLAIDVPTITVDSLLRKHGFHDFDLLQIDTEGYDAEVVRHFADAGFLPPLVRFEHVHLDWTVKESCLQNLNDRGFRLHVEPMDILAVHENVL